MLEVKNLHCKFGNNDVLKGISFSVSNGEVVTIIGGSGAGKTTIIRALCGLENFSDGTIKIEGHKSKHGDFGLVQQGCCLFSHMTVLKNVSYALKAVKNFSSKKADESALKMLAQFGLSNKANEYSRNLSGGQKQRVAIARTLVMEPKILLFDEPTSALDPEMTSDVIGMIKNISAREIPVLIVTHDLMMAKRVSNRILFLEHGTIVENSKVEDFFSNPQSERAKSFLKNAAIFG